MANIFSIPDGKAAILTQSHSRLQQKAVLLLLCSVLFSCSVILIMNVLVMPLLQVEPTNPWFNWCLLLIISLTFFFLRPLLSPTHANLGLAFPLHRKFMLEMSVLLILYLLVLIVVYLFFSKRLFFRDVAQLASTQNVLYFLHVLIQDVLAISLFFRCLLTVLDKVNYKIHIVLTSILFGILHVTLGFASIVACTFFSAFLCALYLHQQTIWGAIILHYLLGLLIIQLTQVPL